VPKYKPISTSLLNINERVMKIIINFICIYSRVKKNGLVPIYCVLKKGTEVNRFSTKLSIQKNLWDASKNRAKGKTDEAILVNEQLESIHKKLNEQLIQLYNKGGQITITELLEVYFQKTTKHPTTLMAVYKVKFEKMTKLVGKDYTQSTLSKYTQMAKAVQEFIKMEYKSSDVQLSKIKRPFIDDLELFLRSHRCMKPITSNKVLQGLKSIIIYAMEREWIDRDPFIGHSFKKVETEILYLTQEQITKLETTILSQIRLEKVKELFLFSIYTGLHYADAMSLTTSNLVNGVDGNLWIDYVRGKTGKRIQIPLLNKAQALLARFEKQGLKNDYILPRITNQKVNSYLKEIGDIVNIDVPLTHKIARKTFGSILLFNNVPIKVVSELMGHSNSLITERHYAKLDTRKLGEAMRLLE
jgi:integrase/recombinase XerD